MSRRSAILIAVSMALAGAEASHAQSAAQPDTTSPPPAAQAAEKRGDAAVDAGRNDEAERDYDEALKLAPVYPPYLADRGDVRRANGKYADAI